MAGLFDGTRFERPVTCEVCEKPLRDCRCPRDILGKVLLPSQQTAVVRLEKRARATIVTLVEGLDPKASDMEGLLKKLRSTCAAGGTVRDGIIAVQGDHRSGVGELLRRAGYRVKAR